MFYRRAARTCCGMLKNSGIWTENGSVGCSRTSQRDAFTMWLIRASLDQVQKPRKGMRDTDASSKITRDAEGDSDPLRACFETADYRTCIARRRSRPGQLRLGAQRNFPGQGTVFERGTKKISASRLARRAPHHQPFKSAFVVEFETQARLGCNRVGGARVELERAVALRSPRIMLPIVFKIDVERTTQGVIEEVLLKKDFGFEFALVTAPAVLDIEGQA